MIGGIVKTDVCTIAADQSVKAAATIMRDRNIGDVVVVEPAKAVKGAKGGEPKFTPIGILTDRDIVCACVASDPAKCDSLKVCDVMSKNIACVDESAGVFDAIRAMRKAGVGRMLVVDNNNCLKGILTANTIFDLLCDELYELGQLTRAKRPNVGFMQTTAGQNVGVQPAQTPPQNFAH
jgi:predicted transcriptional regulator